MLRCLLYLIYFSITKKESPDNDLNQEEKQLRTVSSYCLTGCTLVVEKYSLLFLAVLLSDKFDDNSSCLTLNVNSLRVYIHISLTLAM
jgi:hypothetical protein